MVKTRPNKKPNKAFEADYVHTRTSKKVSKRKKPKKPSRRLSPRGKQKHTPPSSDSGEDFSPSPPRKKLRKRTKHEPEKSSKGLTIVFARKGRDMSISGKRGKKSSKSKSRHIEDPRSTSAAFKRKGMDRVSRPDSPTRGIEEVDRIKLAIDDVKSGEVSSVQKAAFKWRIHADKLYRRLKGSVRIDGRNGPPPVLSRAEEDKLTTWINTMSERGFPVSSGSLRNTVQNFLKQDKRDNPFTDDKPSMSWYKAFVRRNPKVKTVSSMMLTRSLKSTQDILKGWYMEFDNFLKSLDIADKPEKIWHFVAVDLSSASNQPPVPSSNSSYENGGKEKVCTCIVSGNAAGLVIPPFFVFRGHCAPSSWDPLVGAPLSSGLLFTQMGSSCKTMYSDWLENHFLPNIGTERPIALLLDCPEGHIDVDVFVTAQQNDVHMFRILPAIADIVCPIPEEMLSSAWDIEADAWNKSHPLVPVSIKNAARIVGKAWPKVDRPEAIIANFRRVGVYPVELGIVEDLLTEKLKRDMEMEDANRLAALKPAQSIISLELFESKLDKDKKEQFHRQLLAKENGDETDEFKQWKQLYEEVYGKIIPVHDVPVAEEEVTVSYVEHVIDHPQIIETDIQQTDEVVTVEMKKEIDPSQIILSSDLSSVPRDVINVALTMATDIATYRTEGDIIHGGNQVSTTIPVAGPENALEVTSSEISCVGGVEISSQVHDGGEVASSEEVVTTSEFSQSNGSTIISTIVPTKTSDTYGGFSSNPSIKREKTIVNVVPVPQKTGKHTVVNVIRVTPGEKRGVSHSNIAVHQSPISLAASGSKQSATGFFHPVSAGSSSDRNSSRKEEVLPIIHISDSGEVSVGRPEQSTKEIVEVTEVVEVDSSQLSAGVRADQIIQQFEVTGVEEVGGDESKNAVVVVGEAHAKQGGGTLTPSSQPNVVVSGDVGLEAAEGEEEFVYHINIPDMEAAHEAALEDPNQGGVQMEGVIEGVPSETENQTADEMNSNSKEENVIENGSNQKGSSESTDITAPSLDNPGQSMNEKTKTVDKANAVSESEEHVNLQEMNVAEGNVVIQVENMPSDGTGAPVIIDSVADAQAFSEASKIENWQTLQNTEQTLDDKTTHSEGSQSVLVSESTASSSMQIVGSTEENVVFQVGHMTSEGTGDPVVSDLVANSEAFTEASKVGNLMQGDIIMEGDVVKTDDGEAIVVGPSSAQEEVDVQVDVNMTEVMVNEGDDASKVPQPEVPTENTSEAKAV